MLMNKVVSHKQISTDKILVNYVPKLDYDVITSHNLDFRKVANKYKDKKLPVMDVTSIVISAAVTSYARIHMCKLKLDILKLGGELYYSDTDSIVTNIELPTSLVSNKKLGLLKLEHVLVEAIFISNKLYWMCDIKGEVHVTAKGIKASSLNYYDFAILLNKHDVNTAVKRESKIHWDKGYAVITDKENILISSSSYTKRIKIYNNNKLWFDTAPVFVNKVDYNLVVSKSRGLIIYKKANILGYIKVSKSTYGLKDLWILILLLIITPIAVIGVISTLDEDSNIYDILSNTSDISSNTNKINSSHFEDKDDNSNNGSNDNSKTQNSNTNSNAVGISNIIKELIKDSPFERKN